MKFDSVLKFEISVLKLDSVLGAKRGAVTSVFKKGVEERAVLRKGVEAAETMRCTNVAVQLLVTEVVETDIVDSRDELRRPILGWLLPLGWCLIS